MSGGKALTKAELLDEYYAVLHDAYGAMRNVFKRLAASGLTQDDLAEKLGVDKALVSKRLRGRENLTLKTMSFMATAMGCRLSIGYVPFDAVQAPNRIEPGPIGFINLPKPQDTSNDAVDLPQGWQMPAKAA
jgi:transcriptional regulator with XRE-family HTH domain